MLVLVLQDEKGELWKDISVAVYCTETDTYKVRQAERQLFRKFAEYWLSGRFSRVGDELAKEFGIMLFQNGWKVRLLLADLMKEKEPKI